MISGPTFDKQIMTPAIYAEDVNFYMGGNSGIRRGITYTISGRKIIVAAGSMLICGRTVDILETESITASTVLSGTMYSRLVFTVDLSKENTEETFTQGYFEILASGTTYPELTQEDLISGSGKKYQIPIMKFLNTSSGISGATDDRCILSMGEYAKKTEIAAEIADRKAAIAEEASARYAADGFLYKATLTVAAWTSTTVNSAEAYTQTVTPTKVNGGPTITAQMQFEGPMCRQTNNTDTNEKLLEVLNIINKGCTVTGEGTVTVTVSEKPTSDIDVYWRGTVVTS